MTPNSARPPLLSVSELTIDFDTVAGPMRAVDNIGFDIHEGETVGIVGESGSGKSVTVRSLLGLLPSPPARIVSGTAMFDGRDLFELKEKQLRKVRGSQIGMVFQDPIASLDPMMKVGRQITEAIEAHHPAKGSRARAIALLKSVHVPDAESRFDEYPHQFSGGMAQRALIATAIANSPRLIIADEPTTALDVTIQAQVLRTLREVQEASSAGMILITHDLGVVAQIADRVLVMYAGRIVEQGPVEDVFDSPTHPYTVGLLRSIPRLGDSRRSLIPIKGQMHRIGEEPTGCVFHPRCDQHQERRKCIDERPALTPVAEGRASACHFYEELLSIAHKSTPPRDEG